MLSDCYYPKFVDVSDNSKDVTSSQIASPVKLELGIVHNVSGSAYLNVGGSKIICSVHGPYARASSGGVFSSTGQLECDLKYASSASVSEKTATVQAQTVVDALQSSICLDKYAKMTVSIAIVVLESEGCELSHSICCASLALLHAGIEMRDLVYASTVAMLPDGTMVVDPSRQQSAAGSSVTVATSPSDITQVYFEGKGDLAAAFGMIQQCSDRNTVLRRSFREQLLGLLGGR